MLSPAEHRAKEVPADLHISRVELPTPSFNKYFYVEVGRGWRWRDRLVWTDQDWHNYVHLENLCTFGAFHRGAPVGYYELLSKPETGVEIAYFGLMPAFIGQGFGGALLSSAIQHAWELGPERVWLHTCTLDHPAALRNYQARGFQLYEETTEPY